jgi:hypothetical protein
MATNNSIHPHIEYRDAPGRPGYRVGSDGSVWSCRKRVGLGPGRGTRGGLGGEWRRMNPGLRAGYPYVKLSGNTKVSVHRLVLEAFVGPCPDGMQACHIDGNQTNNRLSNLRWDTPRENSRDRITHGTQARGERCGNSKLTEEIVRAARNERIANGTHYYKIARKYGVATGVMFSAITGRTWAHVT